MNERLAAIHDAVRAFRLHQLDAAELASWADAELSGLLGDDDRRYAFADDVIIEVLGLLASCAETPDAEGEVTDALALLSGEVPFSASRLLLLDPAWLDRSPLASAAHVVSSAGQAVERGEPVDRVVSEYGADLVAAGLDALADDYVSLLIAEAGTLMHDLRLARDGEIELLGPGRPRMDVSLVAEKLANVGQVLRGERPFRATVGSRGPGAVRVVLSY